MGPGESRRQSSGCLAAHGIFQVLGLSAVAMRGHHQPARDFIGYGRNAPKVIWPNGAKVAINLVLVYEEGAEYSWLEDNGRNDNWGEYNLTSSPAEAQRASTP